METCQYCNGYGRESCGVCWGGQKQIYCLSCSGRGFIKLENGKTQTCKRCKGKKVYIPSACPICGNSTVCQHCEGSGKVNT